MDWLDKAEREYQKRRREQAANDDAEAREHNRIAAEAPKVIARVRAIVEQAVERYNKNVNGENWRLAELSDAGNGFRLARPDVPRSHLALSFNPDNCSLELDGPVVLDAAKPMPPDGQRFYLRAKNIDGVLVLWNKTAFDSDSKIAELLATAVLYSPEPKARL